MEDSNLPVSFAIIIGAVLLGLFVFAGLIVTAILMGLF